MEIYFMIYTTKNLIKWICGDICVQNIVTFDSAPLRIQ